VPADPGTVTDITLGEVYRLQLANGVTLEGIKESVDKRPTWEAIDRLEDARDAEQAQQNKAIKALEDQNTWLVRTVGAALVTALAAGIGVVSNLARLAG
jgi:DNA-binding transcriptional MerR regulator